MFGGCEVSTFDAYDYIKKNFRHKKGCIMILGKTGVGKSTLINTVFGEALANTGIGEPITKQFRKYSKQNFPISIMDAPGLELGGENSINNILSDILEILSGGYQSINPEDKIRCVCYCVCVPSHRFEVSEKLFVLRLAEEVRCFNIPLIIILTLAFPKKETEELKQKIEKMNLPVVQIIPILAQDIVDEAFTLRSYGLERLTKTFECIIPNEKRKIF